MKRSIIIEICVWTIILGIVFSLLIFGYSKIFVEPNVYNIQFKDIDGITVGSPVRFMGLNVGYVRQLKSKDKHINVQILVTQKNMKIPNGTIARVEFYGLGGSKSVELMPPDGSCNVGILTDDTIRIIDVVKSAVNFVEILEQIEKYVDGLDKAGLEKFLDMIGDFEAGKIQDTQTNIKNISSQTGKKFQEIQEKEKSFTDSIKNINENVEKINNFIKR